MFEHFISNLWWNSSFWYLRCLKRGEMSIFSSFSWIMSFSSTFEKLSSFLYCRRIPTSLEYPWFVLVLIYSSQIFRGATHQSRREIWCPPQEQGPHRGPCFHNVHSFVKIELSTMSFVSLTSLLSVSFPFLLF